MNDKTPSRVAALLHERRSLHGDDDDEDERRLVLSDAICEEPATGPGDIAIKARLLGEILHISTLPPDSLTRTLIEALERDATALARSASDTT